MIFRTYLALLFLAILAPVAAKAQEGYEFEVYGGDILRRGTSSLELHLNFVPSSRVAGEEDRKTSDHALRSSVEFAVGLTSWLEGSLYATGYARSGDGLQFVGNRIRLTAIAPEAWSLPFTLGLSQEVGHARRGFAENSWSYELSPILGKSFGKVALLANPAVERGIGGSGEHELELEPRARIAFKLEGDDALALEYYGVAGPIGAFDPRGEQRHQIFGVWNGDVLPRLETAFGIGRGLTRNSDRWTVMTRLELETYR